MKTFELKPINKRKSFYGKCEVYQMENGMEVLKSYSTLVAYKDNNGLHRIWSGYSSTTMNHINAFNGTALSKKEWEGMKIEKISDSLLYSSLKPYERIWTM